jgi:hypothetical protein
MNNGDQAQEKLRGREFARQAGDERAPWARPALKKSDARAAEIGTSSGADLNSTANS